MTREELLAKGRQLGVYEEETSYKTARLNDPSYFSLRYITELCEELFPQQEGWRDIYISPEAAGGYDDDAYIDSVSISASRVLTDEQLAAKIDEIEKSLEKNKLEEAVRQAKKEEQEIEQLKQLLIKYKDSVNIESL